MRARLPGALVGLSLALASLGLTLPAAAATCTIRGTTGNDRIYGTAGADVICALGGNDRVYARGGNDTVLGGPGDDELFGDGGADRLDGGTGNDGLWGRTGNDVLLGGDGADELVDEGGADTVRGGDGNDVLGAGEGTDSYDGGLGSDTVKYLDRPAVMVTLNGLDDDGVPGENDHVAAFENIGGSSHRDVLIGDNTANRIDAGDGNDTVRGLGGADTIIGGGGQDRLEGWGGNDRILGGKDPDLMIGGPGADTLDGGTAEFFRNVCDSDPADTRTRCMADAAAPTGNLSVGTPEVQSLVRPGQDLEVSVNTEDAGGTSRLEARVVSASGGADLGWCPAVPEPDLAEMTRADNSWTFTCSVPADATPQGVTVQVRLFDRLDNVTTWGDPSLSREVAVNTEGDTTAPQVTPLEGHPTYSPGQHSFSFPIADPSGVQESTLSLSWSGPGTVTCGSPTRTSGHLVGGTWTWTCSFPFLQQENSDFTGTLTAADLAGSSAPVQVAQLTIHNT